MRLFESTQTQAAPTETPPGETIIHNYAPSYAWPILLGVVSVFGGVIGLWYIGVFLMAEAGFQNPERALATAIIVIVLFLVFVFLGSWLMNAHFDRWSDYKIKVLEKQNEALRYRQLMAFSSVTDTRLPSASQEARFARLITLVMIQAFDDYAQRGPYRTNDPRPWSRRSAKQITLTNEAMPVGESMGEKVRPWLIQNEVITQDDQINLARYPDLAGVQRLLQQPILVFGGTP